MYIVTETVGQTKEETPVVTAYDGFSAFGTNCPNLSI